MCDVLDAGMVDIIRSYPNSSMVCTFDTQEIATNGYVPVVVKFSGPCTMMLILIPADETDSTLRWRRRSSNETAQEAAVITMTNINLDNLISCMSARRSYVLYKESCHALLDTWQYGIYGWYLCLRFEVQVSYLPVLR